MIFRLVEQYFYSYIPDRIPLIDDSGFQCCCMRASIAVRGSMKISSSVSSLGPTIKVYSFWGGADIRYR